MVKRQLFFHSDSLLFFLNNAPAFGLPKEMADKAEVLELVSFVMKCGKVYKDGLAAAGKL